MKATGAGRVWSRLLPLLGAVLVASACAGGAGAGEVDESEPERSGIIGPVVAAEPQPGGTVTYATYSEAKSLDPTVGSPFGTTGGTEMAAVYDVLVRYDFDEQRFVPQLAQSLDSDPDMTSWTMGLRPDVRFSDGSPVDAAAVKDSIDRYNDSGAVGSDQWTDNVRAVTVVDESTLRFDLAGPWSGFESMLALGHGMVVGPGADDGEEFVPVGAGPFVVDRFARGEEIAMSANPDYWAGPPPLERVVFVPVAGEQARLDALQAGGVDMAFLRNPEVVDAALADGYGGFSDISAIGSMIQINSRDGRPGADVAVRQAVAHAIDPELIAQRVWGGAGIVSSTMFDPGSYWYTGDSTVGYDPDRAREEFERARAAGYDGRIRYLASTDMISKDQALVVAAMLEDVGFTVEVEYASGPGELLNKVHVEHDFDLAAGGWSLLEPVPFMRLQNNLTTGSDNNNSGFSDPEMDAALADLKTAEDDDQVREGLARVQQVVDQTAPFVVIGATRNLIAWNDRVHAIEPSLDGILLLGDAWTER